MKNSIKIIGTIFILSFIFLLQACNEESKKMDEKTENTHEMMNTSHMSDSSNNYACPMHKNITGKNGDKCSECGMGMEEMTYACSMHKDMMGMKGDKCSACGMDMEEMKNMKH